MKEKETLVMLFKRQLKLSCSLSFLSALDVSWTLFGFETRIWLGFVKENKNTKGCNDPHSAIIGFQIEFFCDRDFILYLD